MAFNQMKFNAFALSVFPQLTSFYSSEILNPSLFYNPKADGAQSQQCLTQLEVIAQTENASFNLTDSESKPSTEA